MKPQVDPKRHHRRSIRLQGYDYRQSGACFVTICTHQRELLFNDPLLRRVAETLWQRIPRHFAHVRLDAWVVMPNHIHGIIIIANDPGRGEASPEATSATQPVAPAGSGSGWESVAGDASPLQPRRPSGVAPGSLGAIVGNFKSVTARRINHLRRTPGMPVWQRNHYEHIVRDERALHAIRQYIAGNPARWAWDTYSPAAVGPDPQAVQLWRLVQE
jgi:REP element-mobilizing transposase RayT